MDLIQEKKKNSRKFHDALTKIYCYVSKYIIAHLRDSVLPKVRFSSLGEFIIVLNIIKNVFQKDKTLNICRDRPESFEEFFT